MSDFFIKYKRDLIQLSIIVLAALVIRLLAIPMIPKEIALDNSTYQYAADSFLAIGFIINDYIMPLYPLLLALFGRGEEAQILIGMISGLLSVILVWALARTLFEDKKAGLVAAGMMAVYPMAIFYSVLGLTESLFVSLILGAFLALHKNRIFLASTLFVFSILTRPTMDAFAPFVIFWHALVIRRAGISQAFRNLVVYGFLYALIMSPWWHHNASKYGHFVRLNYGFGLVLYGGNNPENKSGGGIEGIDYSPKNVFGDHLPHSIEESDRRLQDAAIKYIFQEPEEFFRMAGKKFIRFWRLTPYTTEVEGNTKAKISTLSLLPIILFALVTLVTKRNLFMRFTPILGFIAYLTLVHMITIGSIRYRYPLEPLLIVIAAPSLLLIWNLIFGKKTSTDGKLPDTK